MSDRRGVRVHLLHGRLFDVLRQVGQHAVDFVADFLGGNVNVFLQRELDEDL